MVSTCLPATGWLPAGLVCAVSTVGRVPARLFRHTRRQKVLAGAVQALGLHTSAGLVSNTEPLPCMCAYDVCPRSCAPLPRTDDLGLHSHLHCCLSVSVACSYRNVERNWRDFEPYVEENSPRQILQPCSWIGGGADGCSASNSWQGWLTPAGWDGKDPAVWQDAMRAIVPNMQELSIVPDVGHWILMEAPEEVNAQLARFLKHPETQAAMAGSRFSRGGGGAGSAAAKL